MESGSSCLFHRTTGRCTRTTLTTLTSALTYVSHCHIVHWLNGSTLKGLRCGVGSSCTIQSGRINSVSMVIVLKWRNSFLNIFRLSICLFRKTEGNHNKLWFVNVCLIRADQRVTSSQFILTGILVINMITVFFLAFFFSSFHFMLLYFHFSLNHSNLSSTCLVLNHNPLCVKKQHNATVASTNFAEGFDSLGWTASAEVGRDGFREAAAKYCFWMLLWIRLLLDDPLAGPRKSNVKSNCHGPPLDWACELDAEREAGSWWAERQIERDADRQGRVSNHNETVSVAAWSMGFLLAEAPGAGCRWRAARAVIYSVRRMRAFWLPGHFMAHWDIGEAAASSPCKEEGKKKKKDLWQSDGFWTTAYWAE